MIVYNVLRQWFPMKADAETYRKAQGLRPDAVAKVEVADREGLSALLNALCAEALPKGAGPLPAAVHERAFVVPAMSPEDERSIPLFIRKSMARALCQKEPTE